MTNNVGSTSLELPKVIGETMVFSTVEQLASIDITSGALSIGFILSDEQGIIAICTELNTDENGNPIYTFKAKALSGKPEVQLLLSGSY